MKWPSRIARKEPVWSGGRSQNSNNGSRPVKELIGRSLEEIHAANGSGSRLTYAQERVGHPAIIPSAGKTGEGARAGGVSRLCPAGDLEASAETSWFGRLTRESTEAALRVIQRGHRPANDRRPRDLVATHQQARRRAAEYPSSTPTAVAGTAGATSDSKM